MENALSEQFTGRRPANCESKGFSAAKFCHAIRILGPSLAGPTPAASKIARRNQAEFWMLRQAEGAIPAAAKSGVESRTIQRSFRTIDANRPDIPQPQKYFLI